MNFLKFFCETLNSILLFLKGLNLIQFFFIGISIVIYIFLIIVENKYKKTFHKNLVFAIFCSILSINTILIIYSIYPENNIMEKLVQGEILAGIAIAFPTIVLWSYETNEKRLERVKDNYNQWLDKFESSKNIDKLGLQIQLLNILKKCKSIDNNQEIIDYIHLFITIQSKLNNENNEIEDENLTIKQWRTINTELMKSIKERSENDLKLLFDNQFYCEKDFSINSIDFIELKKISKQITNFQGHPLKISFNNCIFNYDDLINWSFFVPDNEYNFNNCMFDCHIQKEDFKRRDLNFKFNGYYLLGEDASKKYFVVEDIMYESYANNDCSFEFSKKEEVFEERELKSIGPINGYLYGKRALEIHIDNSNQGEINKKIVDKVIDNNDLLFTANKIFISRSKNYLQNDRDKKNFNWRSWNVISEENVKNMNYDLYIFAIQLDKYNNEKYKCVILEKEKFRELLKLKVLSKDHRYYFYFTNPKADD